MYHVGFLFVQSNKNTMEYGIRFKKRKILASYKNVYINKKKPMKTYAKLMDSVIPSVPLHACKGSSDCLKKEYFHNESETQNVTKCDKK